MRGRTAGHLTRPRTRGGPSSRRRSEGGWKTGWFIMGSGVGPANRSGTINKAMGLCILCPRPLAEGSKNYCEWHREMCRQRKRCLRGPILCRKCHKPLDESKRGSRRRYHPGCLQVVLAEGQLHYRRLHTSAARAYQERHAAQGLCVQCPRPVVPGQYVCERHLRYRQERYRRSRVVGRPHRSGRKRRSAPRVF